jgi:general secretion pathway protein D
MKKQRVEHMPERGVFLRCGMAALAVSVVLILGGCAAQKAYREGQSLMDSGQSELGLARMEQAVRMDPANLTFRMGLANRRTQLVNQAIRRGEEALTAGKADEASRQYQTALRIDARNELARQGLAHVQREQKIERILLSVEALLQKGKAADLSSAGDRLREALNLQPDHVRAQKVKARLDRQLEELGPAETKLAAIFRQPVTLEFKDAPLKSVMDFISKLSGLSVYFDKDVALDQKTTILAKDSSLDEALRLILSGHQLDHKVLNANSIMIYPATAAKQKEYQTLVVRSFYISNADVKAVANSIKTIVKSKDIVYDERVGFLIMRDTPQAIRMAERIVALQDVPDPEVMLEVEVMEVKRSRLMELGLQWPNQVGLAVLGGTDGVVTVDALRRLNSRGIQATGISANVNLRKEDQDSNILANPRIRVRNKEKAKILIGDKVPVITSTSTATGFSSESVSYIDVGLKLEVEPNVHLDDDVAIKVSLEVSNIVKEVLSKTGALSYQIGTRGANTVLRLKDGETQVLAGLISDEDRRTASKVPGVGELPLLGRLFGSQKDDSQRNEILLSITPHVVRSLRRPDLQLAEFESGTESAFGAPSLRLTPMQQRKESGDTRPDERAASAMDTVLMSWAPVTPVKVGEAFNVALKLSSEEGIARIPLVIGFDPKVIEVLGVEEGGFLRQGGGKTSFEHQVDASQGRVTVQAHRQLGGQSDPTAKGAGDVLTLKLRLKQAPGVGPAVQVINWGAEPVTGDRSMPALPLALSLAP